MKKRLTAILFPGLAKDNFWKLFLFSVFLFHLWTFYLVFRDVPWVIDRFGVWDAVGLTAYALMFVLVECIGIFIFFLVINIFIPDRFEQKQRLSIYSAMILMVWLWSVLGQIYFLDPARINPIFVLLAGNSNRPLLMIYFILIPLVAGSTFLALFPFVKKPQLAVKFTDIIDRISTLSILYLFLDVVGIFIVIFRNIF